jgi:hypothetical protein
MSPIRQATNAIYEGIELAIALIVLIVFIVIFTMIPK